MRFRLGMRAPPGSETWRTRLPRYEKRQIKEPTCQRQRSIRAARRGAHCRLGRGLGGGRQASRVTHHCHGRTTTVVPPAREDQLVPLPYIHKPAGPALVAGIIHEQSSALARLRACGRVARIGEHSTVC